jgi:hypothetical protein
MRRILCTMFLAGLIAPHCHADARWCNILNKGDGDRLAYPPIARAAHVSGHVILRITYRPTGETVETTRISGPVLLAVSAADQLKTWHVKTDAVGSELCQSIVTIDFRIAPQGDQPPQTVQLKAASTFYIAVETEPLILSDPAFEIKRSFFWFLKRRSQGSSAS